MREVLSCMIGSTMCIVMLSIAQLSPPVAASCKTEGCTASPEERAPSVTHYDYRTQLLVASRESAPDPHMGDQVSEMPNSHTQDNSLHAKPTTIEEPSFLSPRQEPTVSPSHEKRPQLKRPKPAPAAPIFPSDQGKPVLASWYGPGFHGNKMANGKRFDQNDTTTVAHKTLPLGTVVRISTETGISHIAVVRDRGPYIKGREFDLSFGLARALGVIHLGVVPVYVEVVSYPHIKQDRAS